MCAAGRKFRCSGYCFRRKMRLCVNNCNSRVLGKIARITVCAENARCTLPTSGLTLLDGFVQNACCRAVHNGCVSCSILKHKMDHPNVLSGDTVTRFTGQVVILSPRCTTRCTTVMSHLTKGGPTSCTIGPYRARCFVKSCALRMHPKCTFSIHVTSSHAVQYRCNGKRGLGACFLSSNYAGVMMGKSRCFGVFPI